MAEVDSRLATGLGTGVIAGSPVERLSRALRAEAAAVEYNGWADSPFGRLVVAALRHMALHGPAVCADASVPVQYGVTLGLSLAADLLADPSSVLPGLFGSAAAGDEDAFRPTYETSSDYLMDRMGDK